MRIGNREPQEEKHIIPHPSRDLNKQYGGLP